MTFRPFFVSLLALPLTAATTQAAAGLASPVPDSALESQFKTVVHPFVETYCLSCHGQEKPEAELDLSRFTSMSAVLSDYAHWDLVLERLEAREMPSEEAKKFPSDELRQQVVTWIQTLKKNEAARNAGDPGAVLARRLNNAEYDYTIRDLTGVDIRPTKEFPVDPANQAGFDNSGESLSMSPALLKKYLQAARTVADHLVLKPEGFGFAPHPVIADTDRDKYAVLRIIDFYTQQPVDLADYFFAAWRYQNRAGLGQPTASLADIARENKVSPKYLATIWETLTDGRNDVGPIAKIRAQWRELPAPTNKLDLGLARDHSAQIRDYVLSLRGKIVPDVKNLAGGRVNNGSQTLVLWKDRTMADNRRKYDPAALHVEGTPIAAVEMPAPARPPMVPAFPAGTAPSQAAAAATAPVAAEAKPAAPAPVAVTPAAQVAAITPAPAPAAAARGARGPRPVQTDAERAADRALNSKINNGGKFLAPTIVTKGSSATSMAASRKRSAGDTNADLTIPADSAAQAQYREAFARFASVFPDAFFISERARVYQDAASEEKLAGRLLSAGIHSQTGYFRDDGPLYDLVLDEAGQHQLDRLWREFDFLSSVPQRMHSSFVWFERTDSPFMGDAEFDAFRPENKAIMEQDKVKALGEIYLAKAIKTGTGEAAQQAIKEHFILVAANIHRVEADLIAAEPSHLKALAEFAERAYRRPLTAAEREQLVKFYHVSREQNGLEHEDAMRDCIAAVLMSPNFCYRIDLVEASGAQTGVRSTSASSSAMAKTTAAAAPSSAAGSDRFTSLSDYALANRLSYFLWSTLPDAELLAHAAAGDLQRPEVLAAQARRLLRDPKVQDFATEFAGQWLDFRRFEEHNAVDRDRFPSFDNELRAAMFGEPIHFFADVARENRSILNFLYGDYTFVNASLAKHYGMPAPTGDEWTRVENASRYERGGLLPMAVFLTANSPGLRTSPVKRGYWVVRRVLGERIPPPPPNVPTLPADEKDFGELSLRDTLARHRADKTCASCHARFDAFGLVFEGYGAIGERRTKDFSNHDVETKAEFPGGKEGTGLAGLRDYVRSNREKDFVDNLCRKLVAYGLGRTLQMSDDALVADMKTNLQKNENHFGALIETLVTSPQFRTKRAFTPPAPLKTAALQ